MRTRDEPVWVVLLHDPVLGAGCQSATAASTPGVKSRYLGGSGRSRRGEDGLLVAGEGRALGDAAVGGGEGDQVHAVEFVA